MDIFVTTVLAFSLYYNRRIINALDEKHIIFKEKYEPYICYNGFCSCMENAHKPYPFMCREWLLSTKYKHLHIAKKN